MRRWTVAAAVLLLAGSGLVWREPAEVPALPPPVEPGPPTATACPVLVDRMGGGRLDIASSRAGRVLVTTVGSGREVGSQEAEVDPAGGSRLSLEELTAGGLAGVLLELGTSEAASSVVQTGGAGVAAARCTPPATTTVVIPGGSTRSGETLELRLVNPYAVDSVVAVPSASESGIDSAAELESVIVPARSIVTRDLDQLLALRTSLSVTVQVEAGAVHAFLAQEGGGDRMLLEGVAPSSEWWLPIPEMGEVPGRLVIAGSGPLDAEVGIDVVGAEGMVEGAVSDVVPADSMLELPLAEVGEGISAIHVISTAPVVATVVFEGEGVRAGAPGVSRVSTSWLAPGVTAGGSGALWLYNPGEVESEVVLQPLSPGAPPDTLTVPAGGTRSFLVEDLGAGYSLRSSSEVAVIYTLAGEAGLALAPASPLTEFDG